MNGLKLEIGKRRKMRAGRPNFNFKAVVILASLLLIICSISPADETNKTPPAAQPLPAGGETAAPQAQISEAAAEPDIRQRDPFWPVGFFPGSTRAGAVDSVGSGSSAQDKKTASPSAGLASILRIGGVVKKGDKFYVTINGFTVQTGEVVSAVADGEVYKFIVEEIDFDKVQVKPVKR